MKKKNYKNGISSFFEMVGQNISIAIQFHKPVWLDPRSTPIKIISFYKTRNRKEIEFRFLVYWQEFRTNKLYAY